MEVERAAEEGRFHLAVLLPQEEPEPGLCGLENDKEKTTC